jgi:FAD:protein FMN transferase
MLALAIVALLAGAPPPGPTIELPNDLETVEGDRDLIRRAHPAMGTFVQITARGVPEERALPIFERAFSEIDRLEAMMSEWKPSSPLSQVNDGAGRAAIAVDRELFDLVALSLEWSKKSGGAFDPTFAALWGLWTFGDDGVHKRPDPAVLAERRKLIDFRSVRLDSAKGTIFLSKPGMKLGLGGIAKGYAVDRAVAILRSAGLEHFVVKAGGELYAAGRNGDRPWTVGLQDPRGPEPIATLEIQDRAFDTSGDYYRYFFEGGTRYHHIIDPATGEPARKSRSASVFAKDCTTADALSTAAFILGPVKGLKLAESAGAEAVIIGSDNRVYVSKGLREKVKMIKAPTDAP